MTERLTFFYFLPAVWRIDGKDVGGGGGMQKPTTLRVSQGWFKGRGKKVQASKDHFKAMVYMIC